MTTFARRVLGSAMLDVATYEEVEADRAATLQAMAVVVASSLATGLCASRLGPSSGGLTAIVFLWSIVAVLGWAAWALLVRQIGGRLLPEPQTRVDVAELLRTLGFATAPGLLRILGVFVPSLAVPLLAFTSVWMFGAMIVAVRQALDYTSTTRAIAVCAIGWVLAGLFVLVLGLFVLPSLT